MTTNRVLSLFLALCFSGMAHAATLLPPGEITFLDNNGLPLAGGLAYFYVPNTLTPKNTYRDGAQTTLNQNPVLLDGSGRAIIYGAGTYRQILKDSTGNLVWDQTTADTSSNNFSWAGITGGSANAQTVTAPNFTIGDGQTIGFVAGLTNTGATTLSVNGGTPINLAKATASGPISLNGGEIILGNQYEVTYSASAGNLQLVSFPTPPGIGQSSTIASASTTDLGTITSHLANISGSTPITSFGASASTSSPFYVVTFSGALSVTYNASSMILPGGGNITTASGDSLFAQYLGSGNWRVLSYMPAAYLSGYPGELRPFAVNACPAGWLNADGTLRSRSTYPTLYAALGTTWGAGDSSTTFGTPDTRGQFMRGWDNGAGLDVTVISGVTTSGSNSVTGLTSTATFYVGMPISGAGIPSGATLSSIASSTSVTLSSNATASATVPLTFTGRAFASAEDDDLKAHSHGGIPNGSLGVNTSSSGSAVPAGTSGGTTASTGGAETRPKNLAVLYCLKT
jgi:microcystin-dependent protein